MPKEQTQPEVVEVVRLKKFEGDRTDDPSALIEEVTLVNGEITDVTPGPAAPPADNT